MQTFEVGMLKALLHSVSLLWVENEHLAEEVQGHRVSLRVKTAPALFVSLG